MRRRREFELGRSGWMLATAVIATFVAAPILSLAYLASGSSASQWPHLLQFVIPRALHDTMLLLVGTGVIIAGLGTGLAWLVTAYEFPGRKILVWAHLLPLAMPTYIVAFSYLDLLHPLGAVPTMLRAALGLANPRDLWLPEVRSITGCVLLFGLVLYPYVYMSARAAFVMQAANLFEVARTLGARPRSVLFRLAVPLARPAIVAGTSLGLMEALNDVGASEFLGVRTITLSIYATWVNRSNLAGAAQIALMLLAVVVLLIALERRARRGREFADGVRSNRRATPFVLTGLRGLLAATACVLPIILGFVLPAAHLAFEAVKRVSHAGLPVKIAQEAMNSVGFALAATAITVALGCCLATSVRLTRSPVATALVGISTIGYAVPGTVLAVGLLAPISALDNLFADGLELLFGIDPGLLMLGSGTALIYAYTARFLTISAGAVEAGFSKISPSHDLVARSLGSSPPRLIWRIHIPLLRPALIAASVLVFVDCMKELPATLLLRPLNVETLATHVYAEAARGTYEDGAIAALLIVAVGLIPVAVLSRLATERSTPAAALGPATPVRSR